MASSLKSVKSDTLKLSELKPYKNNSRVHSETQINSLVAAIEHFGFTQPIIVDEKYTILAGHGRFEAARLLGLTVVPVRIVSGLSDTEKKAYVIADNKIAEQSTWDQDILANELEELTNFKADDSLIALLDLDTFATHKIEQVNIDLVKPHPRNYKNHPADQLEHLKQSIKDHGIYRNIIVSVDNVILAGHGVVQAARSIGITSIPTLKLPIKSTSIHALKLIAADNEVSHLSETDDRALTEILKEVMDSTDLLGTGYDEQMLANLLYVTRPASEIKSVDHAKEWVGMPEYDSEDEKPKVIIQFETEEDKEAFCSLCGYDYKPNKARESLWYPRKERNDWKTVKFEQ